MLAFKDFLKAPDSFLKGHITARLARKLFGDMERLTQEALDLAGPRNDNLIASPSSSMPRMAMMSWSSL